MSKTGEARSVLRRRALAEILLELEYVRLGKPRVVLMEQVPGLLQAEGGSVWKAIRRRLKSFGYRRWRLFRQQEKGSLRKRVWLMGELRKRA